MIEVADEPVIVAVLVGLMVRVLEELIPDIEFIAIGNVSPPVAL